MSNPTKLQAGTRKGWANIHTVTARKYVPKAKKAKQKKKLDHKPKKNRPKPAQIHLSDFINIKTINVKKKPKRKKLSFKEKVLRSEKAFKIKEELKKHPFIIKQQQMRQKRIEKRKKMNTETETQIPNETKKKKTPLIIEKKQHSSRKKQIKRGRIHKSVVDVVEFLVNAVCDNEKEGNHLLLKRKQIKNREKRQRKKDMDKLKKIQPKLIEQRNSFKHSHCGSHGNIQLYSDIRSYSDHLVSDELNNRIGFLLNKLSLVMDEKLKQQKLNRKLFLCGMKECIKTLKARSNNVIGVIISSQMEPLPEWSGLDKMIDEIKELCHKHNIHIIYTLNRKQLNYILKLKPWQGSVSCVTLLDVNVYKETWKRIVEMKNALREQYLMLQYDFIPVYRAISVKPRHIPIYEQNLEDNKEEEEKEEKLEQKTQNEKQSGIQKERKQIPKRSKLSASAAPFDPCAFAAHSKLSAPMYSNVLLYNNRFINNWNGI